MNTDKMKSFMNVYSDQFNLCCKRVEEQLKYLCCMKNKKARNNMKVSVNLREFNSSISMNADMNSIDLYIGFNDIEQLYDSYENGSPFDCFMKVVTHETLHFSLGHLNGKVQKECHAYANGKNAYSIALNDYSLMNIYRPPSYVRECLHVNPVCDPVMMNIAGDFEINELLNMKAPFLNRKDYGLPNMGCVGIYYTVVYSVLNSFPKNAISSKYFQSCGVHTVISDYYAPYAEKLRDLYENMVERTDAGYGEFTYNDGTPADPSSGDNPNGNARKYHMNKHSKDALAGLFAGDLADDLGKKFNVEPIGIWADFRNALNAMKLSQNSLYMVAKEPDWCKYNNRREFSGLLLPGKHEIAGALERKIFRHAVLFVDASASMSPVIVPLYTFCWFALKNVNVEVVFYDTGIRKVCRSTDDILPDATVYGGTSLGNALVEYEEKYKKVTDLYVVTDGYDNTLNGVQKRFKERCKIWLLNGVQLKEKEVTVCDKK